MSNKKLFHQVTPFSPSVCIESPLDSNTVMFSSINNIIASKSMEMPTEQPKSSSTESLGNPVPEAFDNNTKRGTTEFVCDAWKTMNHHAQSMCL